LARDSTLRTCSRLVSVWFSHAWAPVTVVWLAWMPDSSDWRRRSWAAATGSSEGWLTRRPVAICSCVVATCW
jgi:hypothetical protein